MKQTRQCNGSEMHSQACPERRGCTSFLGNFVDFVIVFALGFIKVCSLRDCEIFYGSHQLASDEKRRRLSIFAVISWRVVLCGFGDLDLVTPFSMEARKILASARIFIFAKFGVLSKRVCHFFVFAAIPKIVCTRTVSVRCFCANPTKQPGDASEA